jgi:hypothetical protein
VAPEAFEVVRFNPDDRPLSCGAVVSRTVTRNEPESVRPFESVTVQLTIVSPRAKNEPLP